MKIYTRTGDDGTTGLLGGARVAKDDPRIAAHGAIDELNASLGVCRAGVLPADIEEVVAALQHQMFVLGAELASPGAPPRGTGVVAKADIAELEAAIDRFEEILAPLQEFILPGGTPAAAALHVARGVCRRAERELVGLGRHAPVRAEAMVFVNRVSDLLFVLARAANAAAGVPDVPWQKRP
jgi:cob(I)alamin adenosyltransferase